MPPEPRGSASGKEQSLDKVPQTTGYSVEFEALRLSWLRGYTVKGRAVDLRVSPLSTECYTRRIVMELADRGRHVSDTGTIAAGRFRLRYRIEGTGTPTLAIGSAIQGPRLL